MLRLLKRISRKFFAKLYSLDTRWVFVIIIILLFLVLLAMYYKLIGFGINGSYKLAEWNDKPYTYNSSLIINESEIRADICGTIVSHYTKDEEYITSKVNENQNKSCDQEVESAHISLNYGLDGKLRYVKSWSTLTLSDESRGNVFVFKKD